MDIRVPLNNGETVTVVNDDVRLIEWPYDLEPTEKNLQTLLK